MSRIGFLAILFGSIAILYAQSNSQSECQIARARAQRTNSVINLVPNCESDGQYSALQCHSNSTWCQCWKPDGSVISQPSRKIKRCECLLHRHTVRSAGGPANADGLPGAYVPQCAQNGGYQKKQCHASTGMCWCVNDTGAQVGEKVRSSTLTCA